MRGNPINPPVSTARRPRRGRLRHVRQVLALALVIIGGVGTASAQAGATIQVGSGGASYYPAAAIGQGVSLVSAIPVGRSRLISLQGLSLDDLLPGAASSGVAAVSINGLRFLPSELPAGIPLVAVEASGTSAGANTTYYYQGSSGTSPQYVQGSSVSIHVILRAASPTQAPSGTALQVTANASPNPVSSRSQPVDFSALVTSVPPGSQLIYSWSFGDGGHAYGASVQHTYGADGAWPANVNVTDGLPNDPGVSAAVTVNVGHPARTAAGSGFGTSNATGSGAGGSGTGKGGTGGGAGTGGKGATQPKPSPKAAVKPVVRPGAAAHAATPAVAADASQPVRGILLADIGSPLDLRLSPPPPSGSPGAAHKSAGGSSGIAAVIGGLALALAIAGLGGLSERRRGRLRTA